ncbi:TraR/DksA C4-type zinc finger protein [Nocardiopsis sp. L17-MgMaSL7]|uniref:TraR/DksA family transcriptional regulator n=1 Tax=Nocardiopsis sp. L17-MgMaSL7 TaxID=1938893 RepID=UPI000D714535|nr:TraR/DksA C4-type zinc finger protein [Nocardiopsis sp. L17-MgMaSL7]PWV44775.1 TraR/DksA family transcriptional regulator [Nocardiopsis sp. L17-MgMaSL7]
MVPSERSAGSRPGAGEPLRGRVAEIRGLLTADRERTSALILSLTRSFDSIVEATQDTATDDEHDPEGSTIAFERSHTSAALAAAERHLADVDAALERIAQGRYGRCERCGEPVSPERLLARPVARTCIACATRA